MSTATTLGFVEPVIGDPMCYDPAVPYPHQTSVKSLAASIDAWQSANLDPDAARLTLAPRVRISRSNYDATVQGLALLTTFDTVEFNFGTATSLSVNNSALILGPGLWVVVQEVLFPASTDMTSASIGINFDSQSVFIANPTNTNEPVYGGGGTCSALARLSATTNTLTPNLSITSVSGLPKYLYFGLTAIKIADYF